MIWRRRDDRSVRDPDPVPGDGMTAIERTLDEWCEREIRYWSTVYGGGRDFTDEFARLNQVYPTIFILTLTDGTVTIGEKHDLVSREGALLGHSQAANRMRQYLPFIQEAVHSYAPSLTTVLALDVHDESIWDSSAPIFSFQKTAASRNILVPDIDFMNFGWYARAYDEPDLASKLPSAVFFGASTGGGILNSADVTSDRSPRLRLARNLFRRENILFRIGAAAQCDTPETAALLQTKPYFMPGVGWEEQLRHGMVISVDGNGATCSRVVNTLRSRSVLVKLASPHRLYYFDGMKPWEHYLPFDNVLDLDRIVEDYIRGDFDVAGIVARANRFFDDFLSREPVFRYMAKVLARYQCDVIAGGAARPAASVIGLVAATRAHISGVGDVVAPVSRWLQYGISRPIEGIELIAAPGVENEALRYRCAGGDGAWGPWHDLGCFCGTRGEALPICGIEIALGDGHAECWELRGDTLFFDGSRQSRKGSLVAFQAASGAMLTDIRLAVHPKDGQA